jgi:hypothetical protein
MEVKVCFDCAIIPFIYKKDRAVFILYIFFAFYNIFHNQLLVNHHDNSQLNMTHYVTFIILFCINVIKLLFIAHNSDNYEVEVFDSAINMSGLPIMLFSGHFRLINPTLKSCFTAASLEFKVDFGNGITLEY